MHSYTIIGILIMGLSTIIGTYLIQKGNSLKNREKSNEMIEKLDTLKTENTLLKEKLNNTNDIILKSVLGGDSICVISFYTDTKTKPFKIQFYLQNFGNFPMYDISITQNQYDNNENIIESHRDGIGNIAPKGIGTFTEFVDIPKNGILNYRFTIVSRNGVFIQRLETRWSKDSNGLLASATRVQQYENAKIGYVVVRESFDPDFPEQEKQKVIWDIGEKHTGIVKRRLQ